MKKIILCGMALIICVFLFFQAQVTISGDAADASNNDKIVRFMWWTDTQYSEEFPYNGDTIFMPLSPGRYRLIAERLSKDYNSGYVSYGIFTGDFVWEADSTKGVYPWAVGGVRLA